MSTLRDVAATRRSYVATASRVITGSTVVRPETRDRVEQAMRELLYVPPGARLRPGRIGLLVPEFTNPAFAALAQALENRATKAGFAAILCNTGGSAMQEAGYVHMLLERRVEGMVFICAEVTDVRGEHAHYAALLDRGCADRLRQRRLRVAQRDLGRSR